MTNNPCSLTPEEYFGAEDLGAKDIGRPLEQTTKVQKFKATLSLCEEYPLSLQEQVIPIIDLMAASNAHFKKLKDFITLQLPSGFPVKIGQHQSLHINITCKTGRNRPVCININSKQGQSKTVP